MGKSYPDRTNASGVWKINEISKNKVTHNTYPDGSKRALFGGGSTAVTVEQLIIETAGNSTDFGDLTDGRGQNCSVGNATRSIFLGGASPGVVNIIDFVQFATAADYSDFGDLTAARRLCGSAGNDTRGMAAAGISSNVIDFITLASTGNATDFGNTHASAAGVQNSQCNSNTRALFAGFNTPGPAVNVIDFVEISSTGNAIDFGNLTVARSQPAGICSSTRGIWAGGTASGTNGEIDHVTIASHGNAADFGDLTAVSQHPAGMSSEKKGVFAGCNPGTAVIDQIIIASLGNSVDFGDCTSCAQSAGGSNGHGGLALTS